MTNNVLLMCRSFYIFRGRLDAGKLRNNKNTISLWPINLRPSFISPDQIKMVVPQFPKAYLFVSFLYGWGNHVLFDFYHMTNRLLDES